MRPPASIEPWLSPSHLQAWLRDAPSTALYQRRLVIWLASSRRYHAAEIGEMVQVGVRSVQRWIRSYNEKGPRSLDEDGRGGRRWGYATPKEERRLLSSLTQKAGKGQLLTVKQIRPSIEAALGHEVSSDYVYNLLGRHDWRKVVPRPRHKEANLIEQIAFKSELP